MVNKKQKCKSIRMLSYAFMVCALPLLCIGCKKNTDVKGGQIKFEVDKDYQRGPLTVHLRLSKTKMTIAETFLLEFEATIEPGFEVQMPKMEDMLKNFGIVDWDNLGDKLDENNNTVSRNRYRLEPFLSGTFSIAAFTFHFTNVNKPKEKTYELTTEPIDIEVTSLLGADRDKLVIADIDDVVQIPKGPSYWWAWLAGAITVILAIIVWLRLRAKRTKELIRIFKSAHEIAYDHLRALIKEDLVKKGKIKAFYKQISDILRHYIEHRFNLRAPERTTEEFLVELARTDVLDVADRTNLGEFLKLSDLVKFAKHHPTTEQVQKTFDLAKNFIEKTKSDEKKIDITDQMTGAA